MRTPDFALLAVLLLASMRLWTGLRRSRAATVVAVGLVAGALGLHLAAEPRWQLAPAYAAALVVLVATVVDWRAAVPPKRALATLGAVLLVSLAGLLAWLLPPVELPPPSGPYPVGTRTALVEDPQRADPYDPMHAPRRVAIQVWYPTTDTAGPPAPWLAHPDEVIDAIASIFGVPAFLLSHLTDVDAHARPDAAITLEGHYPLVVYSHGWSGSRLLHVTQLESLASHGYVVIGIDHTYAALVTVFPDGSTVPLDPATLPTDVDAEEYAEAARTLVEVFAADIEMVIDEAGSALDDDVRAIVDPDRTALLGHSTGGGAAYLVCSRHRWCGAAVGFDPWVEPLPDELVGTGMSMPLLSVRSEDWLETPNDARLRRLHAGSTGPQGRIAIDGTLHRDFSMVGLISPWSSRLGIAGLTPARDTQRIIDAWTVDFLEHHLRGRGSDPLERAPANGRVRIADAD